MPFPVPAVPNIFNDKAESIPTITCIDYSYRLLVDSDT